MSAYARMMQLATNGKRGCFAYQWIGQSFEYCDNCGKPFWEHSHEVRQATGKGIGHSRRVIISEESRAAVRAKWEGYTERLRLRSR